MSAQDKGHRYPGLTREIWKDAWARAVTFATRKGYSVADAHAMAGDAVVKALDPERSPWTATSPGTFARRVCSLLWSAHGNRIQSYAFRNVRSVESLPGGELPPAASHAPFGEALFDANEQKRLADARYRWLEQRVAGDPLIPILLARGETMSSTERALAAGHSHNDIRLARERLKRHIEAVVREIPTLPPPPRGPS